MIRTLVVDGHPPVRRHIAALLAREPDVAIVGDAASLNEALSLLPSTQPDVVVLASWNMVVVTCPGRAERPGRRGAEGARGYLVRSGALEALVKALREQHRTRSADATKADGEGARALGPRETQVLRLIAEGNRSSRIAAELGIAVGTVEVHRRNLMRKLGLHSIAELTKYAIREGLTSL